MHLHVLPRARANDLKNFLRDEGERTLAPMDPSGF